MGAVVSVAVALTSVAALGQPRTGRAPASPQTTISPALPPSGGFAVAAEEMDETLRDRLTDGWPGIGEVGLGGDRVSTDTEGELARVVRAGSVVVDTARGPGLVEVDVRRTAGSCATAPCRSTTRRPGTARTPSLVQVVVADEGVEVRVRAWAGPRPEGSATLRGPALPVEVLRDLAADAVWRR
ncbi:MAG: hypothetical protein JWN84_781 [Nocardioides sp.]|nr:hypothetical protein [Nocardioides sp.]